MTGLRISSPVVLEYGIYDGNLRAGVNCTVKGTYSRRNTSSVASGLPYYANSFTIGTLTCNIFFAYCSTATLYQHSKKSEIRLRRPCFVEDREQSNPYQKPLPTNTNPLYDITTALDLYTVW